MLDTDYGSISIDSEVPEVERLLAEHFRSMTISPFAARSLHRSFEAATLDDVSVEGAVSGWFIAAPPAVRSRSARRSP